MLALAAEDAEGGVNGTKPSSVSGASLITRERTAGGGCPFGSFTIVGTALFVDGGSSPQAPVDNGWFIQAVPAVVHDQVAMVSEQPAQRRAFTPAPSESGFRAGDRTGRGRC